MMESSMGILQCVITSVLSFHGGIFSLSFIAFGQLFFFPFLPDLADRKHKTLLEGCCQLAEVLAILFLCVDPMELTSDITLVIVILPNKLAALVLLLASGSNRL